MLTQFHVDASSPLQPTVEIDGQDVTRLIRRVTVDVAAQAAPQVFLELIGAGGIQGEGIVHVVKTEPAEPVAVITSWLDHLDPEELERCMLEQFEGLSDVRTGEACLAVLKAWARGD